MNFKEKTSEHEIGKEYSSEVIRRTAVNSGCSEGLAIARSVSENLTEKLYFPCLIFSKN